MARYARKHILIMYNIGGPTDYAAVQLRFSPEAGPEHESQAKDVRRGTDGRLTEVSESPKKEIVGEILLYDGYTTETVTYDTQAYDLANTDEVHTILTSETDVQYKRHGDSAFWYGVCITPWRPRLLTPDADYQWLPIRIIEDYAP